MCGIAQKVTPPNLSAPTFAEKKQMKAKEIIARAHKRALLTRGKKRLEKLVSQTNKGQVTNNKRLSEFINKHYELRYNLISMGTEYRLRNRKEYHQLTQRDMNAICLSAQDAGIECWDRDIYRHILSTRIKAYHPFKDYIEQLPQWDGTERVDELARRVSNQPIWVKGFHRWMLAMVAQWMGLDREYANSVMPILVSEQQGLGKSTFCRSLLPSPLKRYYTDSINQTNIGQLERRLTEMGLINLDEFDQIPERKHPMLKNIMQLTGTHIRKAYQRDENNLLRLASFIGTSNTHELLTDPSGSRRFICVDVEHPIDCRYIQHRQIFAQLKEELQVGFIYWFTKEEEKEIQEHNRKFYKSDSVLDILSQYFRPASPTEESKSYSLQEIITLTRQKSRLSLSGIKIQDFSKALRMMGVERKHHNNGNKYRVVEILKS